ncbi:hypothetical protein [Xanthobacter autotrophicus]|uniref:hypothetical protein n=1 Tax=Xanthobacter autotrophicus TaxID=280 RepID=UPI0024A7597D|nr:hypothetical protein [Xanthobacter autotrophicus]MDI4658411.1 hypothetical protein [Xanthobacter autotrophicus]
MEHHPPPARPRAGREPKARRLPFSASEIILIVSVAALVLAAAIQAVIALALNISAH